jgi:hypothetical protein
MTTATEAQAPDPAADLLGSWRRDRGFGLGPFGDKWWIASLNKTKITLEIPVIAIGSQIIEVIEVTPDGDAVYREYFVNPDGDLVKTRWVSQYEYVLSAPAGRLRGTIKRMQMTKAEQILHTAQTLQFPSCRIVRRIEHGRPVDEHRRIEHGRPVDERRSELVNRARNW